MMFIIRCSARAFCMVAFEHELGHPHQHGEEVVKQRRGIGREELTPHRYRRAEAERRAGIELGRDDIDDLAFLHLHGITGITEREAERGCEPVADDL
jgi:hypothetical protein